MMKASTTNLVMEYGSSQRVLWWWLSIRRLIHFIRYKKTHTLCKGVVNALEDDTSTELWHKRLGHMSEKGLQVLFKKELLPGLKGTHLKTCVHCLAGKQHRVSFHKNVASRKENVLELIHSDVCGPLKVRTHSGALYFVTFIDD